jgi:hypothetical protein
MILNLPKLGPVQFDDSLSSEEFNAELNRLATKYKFDVPRSELSYGEVFGHALGRGMGELGSAVTETGPALAAKALGFDDFAKRKLDEAAQTQARLQQEYPSQFKSLSDIRGIGDIPKYAAESLTEQVPSLATALIPGVGAETLAARYGATAAGKTLAGHAGNFLGAYALAAPAVFNDVYQKTGKMDSGAALMFGAGSAALQSILPAELSKSLSGEAKATIVGKLLEKSGMEPGLLTSVLGNVAKDAGIQGLAGGGSEALNIAAENFVSQNPHVFDSEDWKRIMHASIQGAIVGAPFGLLTGFGNRERVSRETPEEQPPTTGAAAPTTPQLPGPASLPLLEGPKPEQKLINQTRLQLQRSKPDITDAQETLRNSLKQAHKESGVKDLPQLPAPEAKPIVAKTEEPTPTIPDTQVNDDLLKSFGVGPSALLRKNKLIDGLDISNPDHAAQVKRVLEAYVEKRSQPIREKIEAYLARPEFQGEANVTRPDTAPVGAGPDLGVEPINEPTRAGEPVEPNGNIPPVENAGRVAEGEGEQPPAIEAAKVEEPEKAVEPPQVEAPKEEPRVTEAPEAVEAKPEEPQEPAAEPVAEEAAPEEPQAAGNPFATLHAETREADAKVEELTQKLAEAKKKFARYEKKPDSPARDAALDALTDAEFDLKEAKAAAVEARGSNLFGNPTFKGEELSDAGKRFAASGDSKRLLDHLINTVKNPDVKSVLQAFRRMGVNPKIEIGDIEFGRPGHYDPATNTMRLHPDMGLNEHTVVHEFTHAAISHVLRDPNHPLTKEFGKFFEQIRNQLGDVYGAENLQEFAAELTGNPEFQAMLKTIKAPKSGNMFQRIVQSIAEALGFRKGQSAYEKGLKFIHDAIDVSGDVEAHPADKMFMGSAGNFPGVGDIGKRMPEMAGETVENAKNVFSNIKESDFLKSLMGGLRLDSMRVLYGKELPSINPLLDALEQKAGKQQQERTRLDKMVEGFMDVQKKYANDVKRMDQMAVDARRANVELVDSIAPNFKPTKENAAEYARLKKVYNSLDPEVRKIYDSIRTEYEGAINKYLNLLSSMVDPSLAQKLRIQFEAEQRVRGYVPLKRYGNYWIEYADPKTGKRVASSFESVRERQQFVDQNLKGQNVKMYKNLEDIRFNPSQVPPGRFIGNVMEALQKQGASQAQLDSVYQSYISLFPAESIAKQFVRAKGTLGEDTNTVRNFANTMWSWTNKLANTEFNPQIDKALNGIEAERKNANNSQIDAAASSILSQSEFFHNPTFGTLTHTATALSYAEYIAGNVSSAFVNLAAMPMLVFPTLGGKHGFDRATSALLAAGKLAMGKWGETERYKDLYQTLMDHDQLGHALARNIMEGRQKNRGGLLGAKDRMFDALSIPFGESEKFNRASTAIAAYDLALKDGMSKQDAIRYALDTTKDLHTSGLSATSAKWMQNPLGRTFFTFKSFAWNSAFIIGRAFHQAFKNENPKIRRVAQRQLLGIYGMSMVFGGVKGLPFYGMASTLGTIINTLFGDSNEPFDFDEEMRQFWGELAFKGPINAATNLEVANRTGLATDLIYRDDPRGIAQNGYAMTAIKQAFGPLGSYAVGAEQAIKEMNAGNVERGVEALLPSFARNGLKGARYLTEGAQTLRGDPVQEDVSAWNSLMQGIGFAPADLSATYEQTSAMKGYEREVLQKRSSLLNKYDMGRKSGDTDLLAEVQSDIADFNAAHPKNRITGDTLTKSIAAQRAAEKDMIHGVKFNKHLLPELREKFPE